MISVLHCNTLIIEGKATAAVLFYVREFCGFQLCTVVHCYAKWAMGVPVILFKKKVSEQLANYEPGGREFESLRARHLFQLVMSQCR